MKMWWHFSGIRPGDLGGPEPRLKSKLHLLMRFLREANAKNKAGLIYLLQPWDRRVDHTHSLPLYYPVTPPISKTDAFSILKSRPLGLAFLLGKSDKGHGAFSSSLPSSQTTWSFLKPPTSAWTPQEEPITSRGQNGAFRCSLFRHFFFTMRRTISPWNSCPHSTP